MALGAAFGWGAYVLPLDWMQKAGLAGTLIGFVVGGLMIAIIGLSYGFTIRALPLTSGGVAFAMAALGRTHAFIAGWALTLGYSCVVALNASAVTLVFRVTFPELVMRGALSGQFQFFAVVIMIVAVVVIVASMVIYYVAKRPELAPAFPVDVPLAAAVATIIAFAPWAYVGFDSIPQLAGEFNFSPKKALGLLIWGIFAATLIYLAMMLATSIAVGTHHNAYEGEAWPPAAAISEVMGPVGLVLMVVAVSAGVLTGLNGFFTAASRVLFTLGRANLVSSRLGELNGKQHAPRNAILLVCAVCLVTPWFGRAALTWVVDMSSAGITVAYFYTCFCAWKIARTGQVPGMTEPIAPNKFYEYFALAGCILSVGFLALLFVPGSPGVLGTAPLIALGGWIVLGLVSWPSRAGS
ncbi:APC family permease [Corynebacterium sp. HMSC06D04]|uniref:APC family permease n=1 Tax=Corynebacterium sp. HMSC06D04 TaxID=1581123 RepID=UPI0008A4512C|nr:APC family permease [Corynebacterium sp. HMSC06D04]